MGQIPKTGDVIIADDHRFTIAKGSDRRIMKVQAERVPEGAGAGEARVGRR